MNVVDAKVEAMMTVFLCCVLHIEQQRDVLAFTSVGLYCDNVTSLPLISSSSFHFLLNLI